MCLVHILSCNEQKKICKKLGYNIHVDHMILEQTKDRNTYSWMSVFNSKSVYEVWQEFQWMAHWWSTCEYTGTVFLVCVCMYFKEIHTLQWVLKAWFTQCIYKYETVYFMIMIMIMSI